MVKFYKGAESQPSLIVLNQIEVGQENSGTSKSTLNKIAEYIKEVGFNLVIPLVALTDQEDRYNLLTGLPIYEAAVLAGIDRIWVFIIADERKNTEKYVEQALIQSKLNDRVIEHQDVTNFLEFINDKKSNLTQIPGVKDKYALLISSKRPYTSQEDMQKKLGPKRSLTWLKAYKAKSNG